MATFHVEHPVGYEAERRYIVSVVMEDGLGTSVRLKAANRSNTRITLEGGIGEQAITLPDVLFGVSSESWLTDGSLPKRPLEIGHRSNLDTNVHVSNQTLPMIYGDRSGTFRAHERGLYLPIDIFGSAFFMLTRYEELVKPDRDEHGRFPASASLAYQEGFLERPIIDEYVEVLWAAMKRLWPQLQRRERPYRLVPTHDVDRPFGVKGEPAARVARRFGGDLLKRRSLTALAKRFGSLVTPGARGEWLDPNNTFDWLMDQAERHGLRAEFYVMTGKTDEHDPGYDVFAPRIQWLLRRIDERGHGVGLHPSYGTLGRPDLIAAESKTLRQALDAAGIDQPVRSGRQHYLRWRADRTWEDWDEVGMAEDSTVGYADHVGFRAGTCRPYRAWSWSRREPLDLIERPLIAMDGTLLSESYMGLSPDEALARLGRLADRVRGVGGDFVVLWHNDLLIDQRMQSLFTDSMQVGA